MDGSNPKFLEIQIFKPLDRIFHASKTLIDEVQNQPKVIEEEVEQRFADSVLMLLIFSPPSYGANLNKYTRVVVCVHFIVSE